MEKKPRFAILGVCLLPHWNDVALTEGIPMLSQGNKSCNVSLLMVLLGPFWDPFFCLFIYINQSVTLYFYSTLYSDLAVTWYAWVCPRKVIRPNGSLFWHWRPRPAH